MEQQSMKATSGYGANIRAARINAGLSQSQLADLLHYNHSAISSWELNYRRPSYEAVSAMAEIFGCTVDEIILGIRNVSAVKYLERKREICDSYGCCGECPLSAKDDLDCEQTEREDPAEAVRKVIEWTGRTEK